MKNLNIAAVARKAVNTLIDHLSMRVSSTAPVATATESLEQISLLSFGNETCNNWANRVM